MPALAREHTVRGARAFVEFVVAELNYAQETLDTTRLTPLLSNACAGCSGALGFLSKVRRKRGRITGGRITAKSIKVTELRRVPLTLMQVSFDYQSTRQWVRLGSGRVDIYDAGVARDTWILSAHSNGWSVTTWSVD